MFVDQDSSLLPGAYVSSGINTCTSRYVNERGLVIFRGCAERDENHNWFFMRTPPSVHMYQRMISFSSKSGPSLQSNLFLVTNEEFYSNTVAVCKVIK